MPVSFLLSTEDKKTNYVFLSKSPSAVKTVFKLPVPFMERVQMRVILRLYSGDVWAKVVVATNPTAGYVSDFSPNIFFRHMLPPVTHVPMVYDKLYLT